METYPRGVWDQSSTYFAEGVHYFSKERGEERASFPFETYHTCDLPKQVCVWGGGGGGLWNLAPSWSAHDITMGLMYNEGIGFMQVFFVNINFLYVC